MKQGFTLNNTFLVKPLLSREEEYETGGSEMWLILLERNHKFKMPPVRTVVPSTVKCLSKPKLRNPKTVSGNSSNTTLNKPYHLSQGKHCKVRKKNIAPFMFLNKNSVLEKSISKTFSGPDQLHVSTVSMVKFYSGCFLVNSLAFLVIFSCESKNPGSFKEMLLMG